MSPSSDLAAIAKVGNDFLDTAPGQIPAAQAQSLKVGTYQQIAAKYGEMGTATIEAQKGLALGLKDELAKAFPELSTLNAKDGALLDLQPALERAVQRTSNHQLLGIGTPIAGASAAVATGSAPLGVAAGLMKAIVDNPAVKSRLAFAIARASKGGVSFPAAMTRIGAYSAALGNAAQSGQTEQQPQQ